MARLGDILWDGLIAFFGATLDQLLEFPACILLGGLVVRRGRGAPVDWYDVSSSVAVVVLVGVLVRRVVSSRERFVDGWRRVPSGTEAPTASWAHLVWGGAWLWLAHGLWTIQDAGAPGGPREYLGMGPGFLVVAGGLLLLRAVFWIKRLRDG